LNADAGVWVVTRNSFVVFVCVQLLDFFQWLPVMNRRSDFVVFVTCGHQQLPFFMSLPDKVAQCTHAEIVVIHKSGKHHLPMPNNLRWKDIECGVSSFIGFCQHVQWHVLVQSTRIRVASRCARVVL
jgi:hypothetical protein